MRWTVNLPNITLTISAFSSQAETVSNSDTDSGFGFEIHILDTNLTNTVISELHVTAVRQLNGVSVECLGISGRFNSTIQIALDPG